MVEEKGEGEGRRGKERKNPLIRKYIRVYQREIKLNRKYKYKKKKSGEEKKRGGQSPFLYINSTIASTRFRVPRAISRIDFASI